MSATWFDTPNEVKQFFAEHGVKAGKIWILGDSIGVELSSQEDYNTMAASGRLDYYPRDTNIHGKFGIIFYPKRLNP